MALTILEKVMRLAPEKALKMIRSGDAAVESEGVLALCKALIGKDSTWGAVAEAIKAIEDEPEKVRWAVLGYMSGVLLKGKENPRAAAALESFSEPFYNSGKPGVTLASYQAFFAAS